MKSKYFSGGRAGFALALLCAFGFTLASSGTAQAQYRGRDRRESNRDWRRDRRERDRGNVLDRNRNGVDDRYERGNVYDRNRNGVDDRYENGGVYGRNRNGVYERGGGYYGNNGGYYGRGGYNVAQAAANQGYRDGLNTGASDGQRGQSYNPQRSHFYRNATTGYDSSYGNRSTYQQYYRDGFLRGYQEGFRQYGNGRNYPTNRAGGILGSIFGRP
jgi:hypothetical protein